MSLTVTLAEPLGHPPEATLRLEPGEDFLVWALPDAVDGDTALRATVLRRAGEHPPAGALLVLEVDVLALRGNALTLRVARVGPEVEIDLERADGRARVGRGAELPEDGRYEVQFPSLRRVPFRLSLRNDEKRSAAAVLGGSGTRRSRVVGGSRGAFWVVPTVYKTLTDVGHVFEDNLKVAGKRLGLGPRGVQAMTMATFFMVGAAGTAYVQYQERKAAEAAAAEATAEAERARGAQAASFVAEMRCLVEREELVGRLDDQHARRLVAAERAWGFSASRAAALDAAGARLAEPTLLGHDEKWAEALREDVATRLAAEDAVDGDAGPCLELTGVLGTELPAYALLAHPSPEVLCPPAWAGVVDNVPRAGRFGLSDRIARAYGESIVPLGEATDESADPDAPGAAATVGDPRLNDRWSAQTLAGALRDIQGTLLAWERGGRPVVAPAQAQGWALTFFLAANGMPQLAEGALDAPVGACVRDVLDRLDAARPAAGRGEPLLPDLGAVARGEVPVAAAPTAGCPWPPDAIARAAADTLRAVTRHARAGSAAAPAAGGE